MTVHPASAKQINWIKDLLEERDWTNDYRRKGVSRAATLQLMITWAKGLLDTGEVGGYIVPDGIKEAMVTSDHLGERVNQGLKYVLDNAGAADGYEYCYKPFTSKDASALIYWLKPMGLKADSKVVEPSCGPAGDPSTDNVLASEPVELEAGMYKVGDSIYKVQRAVHGSGKMYAKKAIIEQYQDEANGEQVWHVEFSYAPGAIKSIRPEHKLSYEDAKEFGVLYGTCVCCGRTLTDELSIALGIGPICGGRQFGGEFKQLVKDAKKQLKASK